MRAAKRDVVLHELTPTDRGYSLSGETPAQVEITEDGVLIRAKGERSWRKISWADVWINATAVSQ